MCRFFVIMSWASDTSDYFGNIPVFILPRLRIVHKWREGETSGNKKFIPSQAQESATMPVEEGVRTVREAVGVFSSPRGSSGCNR